jgi:hypothetical protein
MVVCAVRYEPVSAGNSLLSGNLTGIFAKFGGFASRRAGIEAAGQALACEFPKKVNRDSFQANRELQFGNRELRNFRRLKTELEC